MTAPFVKPVEQKLSWRFPRTFWIANVAELFERAAYYGMFISLTVYLTNIVGFSDIQAGIVAGCFSSVLYLLPPFMGAVADKVGFKAALAAAFALLMFGYFSLGAFPTKTMTLASLFVIMLGGSVVKPVISGTAAQCSDERHRARAFSIFYQMVNIGAFSGKAIAYELRTRLGIEYINYYASAMAFLAFLLVVFYYRDVTRAGQGKSPRELLLGMLKVLRNVRFMALIFIVAGFWAIQGQLYATMPKYILRLLGDGAKPEWLANINPLVVVLCVLPVTHVVRKVKPENAIGVGLFIIPFSALIVALSPVLERWVGSNIALPGLGGMHPITMAVIIGIAFQGLAECFLSPKFLEYASRQAPPGETGLYLGYQHLTTFFAWFFGFIVSGFLIDRYCPDPGKLDAATREAWTAAIAGAGPMPEAYAHAHYIWYFYFGIGVFAFFALLMFKLVTGRIDAKQGR